MALEAVVFQQDQLFCHSNKDLYNLLEGNYWGSCYDEDFGLEEDIKGGSFDFLENQTEDFHHSSPPSLAPQFNELLHQSNTSQDGSNIYSNGLTPPLANDLHQLDTPQPSSTNIPHPARAKRRRSRSKKNKEEIENQRMTHIAVERNRRKQMNEYLAVLRSLMPEHYVQRGDQASIIGGAINFVKELEQRLQLLGGQQRETNKETRDGDISSSLPFSEFFTFPQYSTSPTRRESLVAVGETVSESLSTVADIEVTLVETQANLKIRLSWRPKQLSNVVSGLHTMRLTILHLNVTTVDQFVFYSLSVKVEDGCKLSSVEEIATAVHQMLGRIQEETILN